MKILYLFILMTAIPQDPSIIFDFQTQKSVNTWYIVNDGVMGGLSKGTMSINDAGNAIFGGYVTTENNGGFASVRHPLTKKNVTDFKSVNIRLKGDGKAYQFRIKEDEAQRHSYIHEFKTSGEWETISIPFTSFYPSFRGRRLNIPNYNGNEMAEVIFLIGNKKKENFELEIKRISLE